MWLDLADVVRIVQFFEVYYPSGYFIYKKWTVTWSLHKQGKIKFVVVSNGFIVIRGRSYKISPNLVYFQFIFGWIKCTVYTALDCTNLFVF